LSEILPFYLVDRLYVSCGNLPVTNAAYSVGCTGRRKLIATHGKFAAEFGKLACWIWKNLPQKTVVPMMASFWG